MIYFPSKVCVALITYILLISKLTSLCYTMEKINIDNSYTIQYCCFKNYEWKGLKGENIFKMIEKVKNIWSKTITLKIFGTRRYFNFK